MAKRIIAVCASALVLTASFWFGAATVGAVGDTTFIIADVNTRTGGGIVGVLNRVLIKGQLSTLGEGGQYVPQGVTPPCPGTSPIVGLDGGENIVILANGDVWHYVNAQWELAGNMLVGVLSAPHSADVANIALTLEPNPAARNFAIDYSLPHDSSVEIELIDLQGRLIMRRSGHGVAGRNSLTLGTDGAQRPLPPGAYLVRVRIGQQVVVAKVTLLE